VPAPEAAQHCLPLPLLLAASSSPLSLPGDISVVVHHNDLPSNDFKSLMMVVGCCCAAATLLGGSWRTSPHSAVALMHHRGHL
jgi:hypothetical protein